MRRIAAALTSVALGLGVALVGVAAPASAHTGDLKAKAVCNAATGEYDVTYTLELTQVGRNLTGETKWRVDEDSTFDGTPKSAAGMDRGPIPSAGNALLTLGTDSLPGTTTGAGPWVYAHTTWSDGFTKGSDGRVEGLKGDCGGGNGDSITYCHASGKSGNYQRITTSVSAFYTSGHIDHEKDIFPAFSFVKHGKRISVEAQGDVTLLAYPDCDKPFDWNWQYAAPTCDALTVVYPADLPKGQANDVNVSIVVDGKTVTLNWHKDKGTWSGSQSFAYAQHRDWPAPKAWTVVWVQVAGTNYHWQGQLECGTKTTKVDLPAQPDKVDVCGADGDHVVEPAPATGITWEISPVKDGKATATARTDELHTFADGTTEHTWNFTFDSKPCEVAEPSEPTYVPHCGLGNDEFTEPVDTTSIDWTTVRGDTTVTVTAKPQPGYAFTSGAAEKTWTFTIDDKPCPPKVITFGAAPTGSDTCGPDNGSLVIPEVAEDAHYGFVQEGSEAEGRVIVRAVADEGYAFAQPVGPWTFEYVNTPCVSIDVAPTAFDVCGVDRDAVNPLPEVEHVTWTVDGEAKSGSVVVVATLDEGYFFADGSTSKPFTLAFDDTECIAPVLDGSVATGECRADVPWISYRVVLTDPDAQADSRTVFLILSDGEHTERFELGELNDEGVLEDRLLWPGATVDDQGNPTGWPGWEQLSDGSWVETEGNFAWTRDITTATFEVNPELTVDLAYPPATPNCATGPTLAGGEGSTPTAGGNGLASTGFAGGTIAIVAGVIVVLGAAVVVIAAIRRKRVAAATTGDSTPTE